MQSVRLPILLLILMLAMAGCERANSGDALSKLPDSVPGNGMLQGTIKFAGNAPVMKTFVPTESCCAGDPPITEETVIVNPNGTLRNVFVYLEGAPKTNGAVHTPALLDQVRCRFVPHVLGIQLGQTIRLRSSDPTMHNVHYVPSTNPAHNYAMTQANEEYQTRFTAGPEFIRMKCDVHPWMTAWVGVFENPFYSVTGDQGTFQIQSIPSGAYKLVVWHELYGRQERDVTIGADSAPIDIDFTLGKQG